MDINKIYLGDCYKLIKEIPDNSVQLVVTDPPYEIIGGGHGGCFGVEHRDYHHEYKTLARDDHKREGLRIVSNTRDLAKNLNCVCAGFDYALLDELDRVMEKINIYIWCNKNQISSLMKHYEDKGCNVDLLVWHKCLGGTTTVLCKNKDGKIFKSNLKDLCKLRFDISPVQIFNGTQWVNIYNVHETVTKEYYRIVLRNGNEFYTTGEHRFSIGGNLIETKDLKTGDVLDSAKYTCQGRISSTVKNSHEIISIKKIISRSLKKMYDVQLQTEDHMFMLSDGTLTHNCNPIPTCNNKYLSDLEYCVFAREPGAPLYGTYETKSKLFETACNKADKDDYGHPTIKPEKIIERLIINSSQPGDLVLDPFLGSGTTAAVAKRLNRKYLGFEIDEHFYNIASDRLQGINQKGEMDLFVSAEADNENYEQMDLFK